MIDLDGGLAEPEREPPQIAFIESGDGSGAKPVALGRPDAGTRIVAAAHPVTIIISALLLRLASKAQISTAVAQVLSPASHLGPRAIEELQKQTVNLLSFQKIPRGIFGSQLAFNLLPRLAGSGAGPLEHLEKRVRGELGPSLSGRAPLPALRVLQSAVFYSTSVSLYVETARPLTPAQAAHALAGEPFRVSRASDRPPSQVEVTGSAEILLDSITADANHPNGLWIWAVADNLRLAATNAVLIAEKLLPSDRAPQATRERVH